MLDLKSLENQEEAFEQLEIVVEEEIADLEAFEEAIRHINSTEAEVTACR